MGGGLSLFASYSYTDATYRDNVIIPPAVVTVPATPPTIILTSGKSVVDTPKHLLRGEIASYELEKRFVHQNGGLIWALLSVSLARAADTTPLYFVVQVQDISSRKMSEAALREANGRRSLS